MSQFGYCTTNANYDDIGQSDCGDTYSSLSGVDFCSLVGGMTEYQQGLLGMTPSVCNQSADYARVQQMYTSTEIPTIASLQFYPWPQQLVNGKYLSPTIVTTDGQVAQPKQGAMNVDQQRFIDINKARLAAGLAQDKKNFETLMRPTAAQLAAVPKAPVMVQKPVAPIVAVAKAPAPVAPKKEGFYYYEPASFGLQ
jgi:hypothetical protein